MQRSRCSRRGTGREQRVQVSQRTSLRERTRVAERVRAREADLFVRGRWKAAMMIR